MHLTEFAICFCHFVAVCFYFITVCHFIFQAANSKRDLNTAAGIFERKNASFFDKLKEKLTTSASINNNGVPEVAVSSENDLKCWCTFKASSMEELACHKQTHHTALSVSVGTTRCPKCRRRCKSTTDLQVHMQCCHSRNDTTSSIDSSLEKITNCSDVRMTSSYRGEYSFPSQMDWDANLRGLNSSGSSVQCLMIMIYVYEIRKLLPKKISRFSAKIIAIYIKQLKSYSWNAGVYRNSM